MRIKANQKKKKAYIDNSRKLVNFFFEVGSLRKVARAHRQTLLTDDLTDNIASHSYRTAMIGWFLAKLEKVDPAKVVMMCLWHDLAESRSGDQHWVNKRYIKVFGDEITAEQLKSLPQSRELIELCREYEARATLAAKVAKDADLLDQVLLLCEYAWQGNLEAKDWLKGGQQEKRMFTQAAKKLAASARRLKPSDWWADLWTAKRR